VALVHVLQWRVVGGVEHDKQIAANRATEQWPITKRNRMVKAADEAVQRSNVQRMMSREDLLISPRDVEAAGPA